MGKLKELYIPFNLNSDPLAEQALDIEVIARKLNEVIGIVKRISKAMGK